MKKIVLSSLLVLLPVVTFAATNPNLDKVNAIIASIKEIVGLLIPIAFSIGLLGFFWGLAKYIFNAQDEEKKSEGKNIMIWGAIALFVMSSIWGIVNFIGETLGVDQKSSGEKVPSVLNLKQ